LVLFNPADTRLIRHAFPRALRQESRFKALRLGATREPTWASPESSAVRHLKLTRQALTTYGALLFESRESPLLRHRTCGHPDLIQGDTAVELGESGGTAPRDWRLLLQVDSEEDIGMMWGDMGRLYYWIQQDDLKRRLWTEVRVILQSH
jgi:hypothetical protein